MIVHFKPVVDSTNTWGKSVNISGDIPHILYANFQTAGRGRQGRKWISHSGANVLMSIVHRHVSDNINVPLYGLYAAYSVIYTMRNIGVPALFKWPNDVWTKRGKLAGILPEAVWNGETIDKVIIGIGINVNQSSFPPDIIATSVCIESGKSHDIHSLVRMVGKTYINALKSISVQEIIDYLWNLFIWRNEIIRINSEDLEGAPIKMDDKGHLIIRDKSGSIHNIMWGEISLRKRERGI